MKRQNATVMRLLALAGVLQIPVTVSAQMSSVHTIELRTSHEIADAAAANGALSALFDAATSCPDSTMELRMRCVCGHSREVIALKSAYTHAVLTHPAWNAPNTAVSYRDPTNGRSVALVFPNLKRQLELCPST
jgi:hypothetical protein